MQQTDPTAEVVSLPAVSEAVHHSECRNDGMPLTRRIDSCDRQMRARRGGRIDLTTPNNNHDINYEFHFSPSNNGIGRFDFVIDQHRIRSRYPAN